MGWAEAWRLLDVLLADPSSQVAAAVAGWVYPLSRTDLTLRDLYDLQHKSKSKRKPKSYPRPWDKQPKRIGSGTSLTIAQYEAVKAAAREAAGPEPQPRDARGRFVKRG